jgi:ADP-heptose:LPS heptosyltransferase
MRLTLPDDLKSTIRAELSALGISFRHPLVVIHPGCSCQARTYPGEGYAAVADLLVKERQADVVFTGLPSEVELVQNIITKMRYPAYSLAGKTDFRRLSAVISLADVAITNNTGPMHICSCLKTPVVVLFAQTNPPHQWGPWRVPYRLLSHPVECVTPCYKFVCPTNHACLASIEAREIVNAARDVLREAKECNQTANVHREAANEGTSGDESKKESKAKAGYITNEGATELCH